MMVLSDPHPTSALDEGALRGLVASFYARVRADAVLGALFNAAIAEEAWPPHLARMVDFWSSVMLTSGRYHGNPMAAHLKHREAISPAMFTRWLQLWDATARDMLCPADADAIIAKAHRIAESLQLALFFRMPQTSPRAA